MDKKIIKYLKKNNVLTIATAINNQPYCANCYYVFDEGKYIYLDEVNRNNRTVTAPKRAAYERIPQGEINKNPKLLPQNPLY